tara:strand:- start:143 stop:988 length:846 start_codon:yes stop_codon:yes gene_type:complete
MIGNINIGDKFTKKIWYRLNYLNKNVLMIICGETGSSKSYSAISLASMLSNKYYIIFNPLEFLKLITSKILKKGDIIIFDEAGVGMSSREWYSIQNKLLGSVLQTFRNLNVGVIFTTPNLSFIDIQARKLFHYYMETANIDYKKELAYLKVFEIQHNSRYDKTYFKHPKFKVDNRFITMSHIEVQKPKPKQCKDYETMKLIYTEQLNRKALESLQLSGKPKVTERKLDIDKNMVNDVIKGKGKFLKEYNKRKFIDHRLIQSEFNLSESKAKLIKREAEKTI